MNWTFQQLANKSGQFAHQGQLKSQDPLCQFHFAFIRFFFLSKHDFIIYSNRNPETVSYTTMALDSLMCTQRVCTYPSVSLNAVMSLL